MTQTRGDVAGYPPAVGRDVHLDMLHSDEQVDAATRLLWRVWNAKTPAERSAVIDRTLLRTLCHTQNYVVGAYREDRLIGCTVGFFGSRSPARSPNSLYSFISGVDQAQSNRGIGYAMKRHQRTWALERGIEMITWTFDPLVARNVYFNLCKLGADVVAYKPDFYGRLDDGLNTNQKTDRLLVEWDLRDSWVEQAMLDEHGGAKRFATLLPEAELISIPKDIGMLRETDPEFARRESEAARDRFRSLMADGYRVAGMSRVREYVLLPADVSAAYEA